MEILATICLTLIVLAILFGLALLFRRDEEMGMILALLAIIPIIIIIVAIAGIAGVST